MEAESSIDPHLYSEVEIEGRSGGSQKFLEVGGEGRLLTPAFTVPANRYTFSAQSSLQIIQNYTYH